jgi:Fe-Mn family superoxide dismutase
MLRSVARKIISNNKALVAWNNNGQQIRNYQHVLPQLSYDIKKGIPNFISPTQLDFHYNKHHQTYVDNLNKLIKGTEFENKSLKDIIKTTAFEPKNVKIFNNAGQHFNHAFYWKCLKPNGSTLSGDIKTAIEKQWNTVDTFKKEFTERAVSLFGSGWAWLVTDGQSLRIWTGGNAQTPLAENLIPLLNIDVWEHAYYLDYQNRRAEYVDKFWSVVDWDFANNVLSEGLKRADVVSNLE